MHVEWEESWTRGAAATATQGKQPLDFAFQPNTLFNMYEQIHLAIWTNTFCNLDKYTLKPGQESISAGATAAQGKQPLQFRLSLIAVTPFLFLAIRNTKPSSIA